MNYKTILIIVALLVMSNPMAWADKAGPSEATFGTKSGDHAAKVAVKYRPFDAKTHGYDPEKSFTKDNLLGTDHNLPVREFDYFKVFLDGNEIQVPKKWYQDCYEPNFADGLFSVLIGDDTKSVFVFMNGSSGAGHYDVIWVFKPDGNHSRLVSVISDMGIINPDGVQSMMKKNEGYGKFPVK